MCSEVENMAAFLKNGMCGKKKKQESSTNCTLNWWYKNDEKVPLLPGSLNEEIWWKQITKKEKKEFFDWWWDKKDSKQSEQEACSAMLTSSREITNTKDDEKATKTLPSLQNRLRYFFNHADYKDIILPGPTFEKILLGIPFRYNTGMQPGQVIKTRIASYTLLVLSLICLLIILIAGFVSFGHFWPKALCLKMFGGPTDIVKEDKVGDLQSEVTELQLEVANLANKMEMNMNDVKENVHNMTKNLIVNMEAAAKKSCVEAE